jgi:hypothetical protein
VAEPALRVGGLYPFPGPRHQRVRVVGYVFGEFVARSCVGVAGVAAGFTAISTASTASVANATMTIDVAA